jgi:hypothetical protein
MNKAQIANGKSEELAASPRRPYSGLWASAFVLLALIMIQAQPLLAQQGILGHSAQGGMVSQVGPLTVLTADASGEDVLLVLEGRSEELFVYRSDRNGVQLQQRLGVQKLFQDARVMSGR